MCIALLSAAMAGMTAVVLALVAHNDVWPSLCSGALTFGGAFGVIFAVISALGLLERPSN